MSAAALDQVSIELGGRRILSDVTFAIEAAEFVGLLGPNGSGKTTLMRALLGLIKPQAGAIRVLNKAVRRGNPAVG